jgi:multicomponent Na+:H+ antiporter subunit G
VIDAAGAALIVLGSLFTLLAGVGVHRFGDPYSRMHAAAKSPTLGLLLVALGACLLVRTVAATCVFVLVAVVQLITAPVSTHIAARAMHLRMRVELDGVDELSAAGAPADDDPRLVDD